VNVITISREYGAGGGEVARRLAQILSWEVLDRELLHQAAAIVHVPDSKLERMDEKEVGLVERFRIFPRHRHYRNGLIRVAREAAARGNVILVGRGTAQLLEDAPNAFHVRLVAPKEWRVERLARQEAKPIDQVRRSCTKMDRTRDRFTRYFFGPEAVQPSQFDIVFNTARVSLEAASALIVAAVKNQLVSSSKDDTDASNRVLTLSRELGAGESGFGPTLGNSLGLNVFDREMLEHEAVRLGLPHSEWAKLDEEPARNRHRPRADYAHQPYVEILQKLMKNLAAAGNVLLVGRGGNRILQDHPTAFHVRLVAPREIRVRRVMEFRWLREEAANKEIAESDASRRAFHQKLFGADWADPLEYHLTVNSGRLGPTAVDLISFAARQHWK
jgi:cytidylate kinase